MIKMRKSGFSMVEVLIFTALFSLIFVGITTAMTTALRNTKSSERRILATHFAQELKDWLKGQKEADFGSFPKSGTYCFNTSPITTWGPNDNCSGAYTLGTAPNAIFKRYVVFSNGSSTQVNVNATVEWMELSVVNSVPLNTQFTVWE